MVSLCFVYPSYILRIWLGYSMKRVAVGWGKVIYAKGG